MKKIRLMTTLITIFLAFVLLISSAEFVCLALPDYWQHEYEKNNSLAYVNGDMSMDDALRATDAMLGYCTSYKGGDLSEVMVTIDGKKRPFFSEREQLHLRDVRRLCLLLLSFQIISIIIIALLLFYLIHIARKLSDKNSLVKKTVATAFIHTTAVFIGILFFVILGCLINFDWAFDAFHKLIFNNNYWILNPYEDELVNLMRIGVFEDTAALIASLWFATLAILCALAARLRIRASNATVTPASHDAAKR